jgi:uncharacterized protein YndB with AHSA1/START domain
MSMDITPRSHQPTVSLEMRKTVRATAERVFLAWTEPAHLKQWWGPVGVRCVGAEVDLRVGGRYRIGNQMPGGQVIWIGGEFESIEPPRELVYTWHVEGDSKGPERVTVRFEAHDHSTEVIVIHQQIPDQTTRESHVDGWHGCLDGLARYLDGI